MPLHLTSTIIHAPPPAYIDDLKKNLTNARYSTHMEYDKKVVIAPFNYSFIFTRVTILVPWENYNASSLGIWVDHIFLWHKTYMSHVIYHVSCVE